MKETYDLKEFVLRNGHRFISQYSQDGSGIWTIKHPYTIEMTPMPKNTSELEIDVVEPGGLIYAIRDYCPASDEKEFTLLPEDVMFLLDVSEDFKETYKTMIRDFESIEGSNSDEFDLSTISMN